jgi:hypothetical protein
MARDRLAHRGGGAVERGAALVGLDLDLSAEPVRLDLSDARGRGHPRH